MPIPNSQPQKEDKENVGATPLDPSKAQGAPKEQEDLCALLRAVLERTEVMGQPKTPKAAAVKQPGVRVMETLLREAGLPASLLPRGSQDDDEDEEEEQPAPEDKTTAAPHPAASVAVLNRVRHLEGSLRRAMQTRVWHHDRNKNEALTIGRAVDELLANHVAPSNPGIAVLMRRLSGLLIADSTGNWDLCSIIANEGDMPFLLSTEELRQAAKVAAVMKQVSRGATPSRGRDWRGGRAFGPRGYRWQPRFNNNNGGNNGGSRSSEPRAAAPRGRRATGAGAQQE